MRGQRAEGTGGKGGKETQAALSAGATLALLTSGGKRESDVTFHCSAAHLPHACWWHCKCDTLHSHPGELTASELHTHLSWGPGARLSQRPSSKHTATARNDPNAPQ